MAAWKGKVAGVISLLAVLAVIQLKGVPSSPDVLVTDGASLQAPSWLLAGSGHKEARAFAAHERDPNFPIESPSDALASEGRVDMASRPGARAIAMPHSLGGPPHPRRAMRAQHRVTQATSAAVGHEQQRKQKAAPPARNANDEWQNDRNRLEKAVNMFSKYGDAALEKLIPKRETKAEYSKALEQANGEIRLLEKEKREDEAETEREKKAVEKIAAALRTEAKSGGNKAAGSGEVERVEEEVERREMETKEAERKGSKVATEISEVPAVGSRASKLMTLRETIKRMQADDQSDDKVMRHELAAVQSQASGIVKASPAHKGSGSQYSTGWTKPSASHPQSEIVYSPQAGAESNAHISMSGFAHTDSSMACEPCEGGEGCHAGCKLVPSSSLAAAASAKAREEDPESNRAQEEAREQAHRARVAHERELISRRERLVEQGEAQQKLVRDQRVKDHREKAREEEEEIVSRRAEEAARRERERRVEAAKEEREKEEKEEEEKQDELLEREKAEEKEALKMQADQRREQDMEQAELLAKEQARDAAEKRSAEEERQMEDDQEKELMKRAKWEGEGVSGDEQAKKEEGSHAQRQAAVLMKEDHAAARVKAGMVRSDRVAVEREREREEAANKAESERQNEMLERRKADEAREVAMEEEEREEEAKREREEREKRVKYDAEQQRELMSRAEYDRAHAPTSHPRHPRQSRLPLPQTRRIPAPAVHPRDAREVTKEGIDLAGWLVRQEDEASKKIKKFARGYGGSFRRTHSLRPLPSHAGEGAAGRGRRGGGGGSSWWGAGDAWGAITSMFAGSSDDHLADEGVNVDGRPGDAGLGGDDDALPRHGVKI